MMSIHFHLLAIMAFLDSHHLPLLSHSLSFSTSNSSSLSFTFRKFFGIRFLPLHALNSALNSVSPLNSYSSFYSWACFSYAQNSGIDAGIEAGSSFLNNDLVSCTMWLFLAQSRMCECWNVENSEAKKKQVEDSWILGVVWDNNLPGIFTSSIFNVFQSTLNLFRSTLNVFQSTSMSFNPLLQASMSGYQLEFLQCLSIHSE